MSQRSNPAANVMQMYSQKMEDATNPKNVYLLLLLLGLRRHLLLERKNLPLRCWWRRQVCSLGRTIFFLFLTNQRARNELSITLGGKCTVQDQAHKSNVAVRIPSTHFSSITFLLKMTKLWKKSPTKIKNLQSISPTSLPKYLVDSLLNVGVN